MHSDVISKAHMYLDIANRYAREVSGCCKVQVGSAIVRDLFLVTENIISIGANVDLFNECKAVGCHRIATYGDDSKNHRLPSDCLSTHSEIDAISKSSDSSYCALFVTRYPCEACAKAIVSSGIKQVYYGREQEVTPLTQKLFDSNGVTCIHMKDWTEEDRHD